MSPHLGFCVAAVRSSSASLAFNIFEFELRYADGALTIAGQPLRLIPGTGVSGSSLGLRICHSVASS